jgi:hypothetical protein
MIMDEKFGDEDFKKFLEGGNKRPNASIFGFILLREKMNLATELLKTTTELYQKETDLEFRKYLTKEIKRLLKTGSQGLEQFEYLLAILEEGTDHGPQ